MTEPTPVLAAMGRDQAPIDRLRRARWLGFLLAMLAFHAFPLSDLVHRQLSWPALVVVGGFEAMFAVAWVRTMWLAQATTVPFRAIRPWLAGVAVLGVGMAMVLGGQYRSLLIYLSIACAVALPLRWTLPALFTCGGLALVASFRNAQDLGVPANGRLLDVVTSVSMTFFLGLMMWFYRRGMMLIIELRHARTELARLAVTEERLRFARDLHDLLGHSLTTISLKAQVARRLADPGSPVAGEVTDIETVAQQALAEVRDAVTGYRGRTLSDELDAARAALGTAGIRVTVRLADARLPGPLDTLLGWVVREGTTNVLRHSKASSCAFTLTQRDDTVSLDITDNGTGPATISPGNGLAGLAERVAGAGGRLDCGPADQHGFRLTAQLPLASTATEGST